MSSFHKGLECLPNLKLRVKTPEMIKIPFMFFSDNSCSNPILLPYSFNMACKIPDE